ISVRTLPVLPAGRSMRKVPLPSGTRIQIALPSRACGRLLAPVASWPRWPSKRTTAPPHNPPPPGAAGDKKKKKGGGRATKEKKGGAKKVFFLVDHAEQALAQA